MAAKIFSLLHFDIIRDYQGSGWFLLLYFVAFIYLIFAEKKKQFRVVLVWGALATMLMFFCPLTSLIYGKLTNEGTYYRLIWMLPIGITIAYAGTKLFMEHRIIGTCIGCALIILGGTYVYHGQYMFAAENVYHLPLEMMEICDSIHSEHYNVMACFPTEYVHEVRQYDSSIELAISREDIVPGWKMPNPIFDEYQRDVIDGEKLTKATREKLVEFLVIGKNRKTNASWENCGWELYFETEHYYVYKDTTIKSTWEKVQEWLQTLPPEEQDAWLEKEGWK